MTRIVDENNSGAVEPSKEASVQSPVNPVVRKPSDREEAPRERFHFGLPQGKLQVWNRDPSYHYHWINDTPGRVEMAMASGYEFVTKGEVTLIPGVVPKDSDPGSRVSAIVGSLEDNIPLRAYLMRTPMEFWKENQKRLQDRVDASEAAIKRGKTSGQEDRNFYTPKGAPIKLSHDR